ncbi:MAG: helix-turn-helix transcriptional regulator [Clostridia bacterium]|nr:helix-turn-helix transcriptional regulator [Clostridia bacterium]
MKIKNLLALINNLLSCDVYLVSDAEKDLVSVEEKINPSSLLEEFTADYLSRFILSMKDNTFYELINTLGERLFMFRLYSNTVIIGPYLKRTIDENEIAHRMFKNNIPSQYFNILKSQYFSCAILDSFNIRNVVGSCLAAFYNNDMMSFDFVKTNHFETPSLVSVPEKPDDKLYEHIYRKFEVETDLLYKIEHGLVDDLKASIDQMKSIDIGKGDVEYYSSHPKEAMASLRAMVRVVALRSGLSVVTVDTILSKYTNLMREAKTISESEKLIESFQIEMAKAIQEYLAHVPPCSPFMKKVTEYIILNYNRDLSLTMLASEFKIAPSYLSHIFKREINRGVKEFIEEIRISNACRFIESTDMSIAQVGHTVGYLDNNYFTKVFKKRMKMTPGAYREKCEHL